MRTFLLASLLALGAGACSKKPAPDRKSRLCRGAQHSQGECGVDREAATQRTPKVPLVSVDEVDRALAKGECIPVDANGDRTRERLGVVPGAVLLSDSEVFALSELPADKSRPLVFYCANNHCGASHEAAARALTAGYTNVKVMGDGIAGWVAAGKHVQTYKL